MRIDSVRWCPAYALTAAGVVYDVRGAPRCPVAAALATNALACWCRDAWGPAPLREDAHRNWDLLVAWADGDHAQRWASPRVHLARDTIRSAAHAPPRSRADKIKLGRALYIVAWMEHNGGRFWDWTRDRSESRSWLSLHGQEWHTLSRVRNYTEYYHILRLFANALPGGSRWRPPHLRAIPRTCIDCGSNATRTWRTPTRTDPGLAWCGPCFHAAAEGDIDNLLGRSYDWSPSAYGRCPLCGDGEVGAEHLLCWCRATDHAWTLLRGRASSRFGGACLADDDHRLVPLLHQVVYLHSVS